jgi:hypothetical protein
MEKFFNTCPRDCYDTCAMITTVENGKAIKLRGNPKHPITQGFLCLEDTECIKVCIFTRTSETSLKRVGKKERTTSGRLRGKRLIKRLPTEWRTYRQNTERAQSFHFTIMVTWDF